MSLTPRQLEAIQARGDVVVVAGAGTGKTRTLVERAVQLLLDPTSGLSLDQILMVTFTEAAAAEMRQRIRHRLEEELVLKPHDPKLAEQLALLDTAQISTLHSFCLQLVRQHFYELGQDPQLTVLADEQAQLLASEVLDQILTDHYQEAKNAPASKAVLDMLQSQNRGWEKPTRELVRALHQYTQTRPDPERWISEQLASFQRTEPSHWRQWLLEGFAEWRALWLPVLALEVADNPIASQCHAILLSLQQHDDPAQLTLFSAPALPSAVDLQLIKKNPKLARLKISDALERIRDVKTNRPRGRAGGSIETLKHFFKEVEFLHSVTSVQPTHDPLTEDWNWIRPHMITLLNLTRQFGEAFAAAKREAGHVDFNDLEQLALRLLWDPRKDQPTALAQRWRTRFQAVFVDEYQDINAAQDRILTALSHSEGAGNRFIVGDMKQSIYRFRQAEPGIFQGYVGGRPAGLGVPPGAALAESLHRIVIHLADNFRSSEPLLAFINSLFGSIMRAELGGVDYDQKAQLRFGDPERRGTSLGSEHDKSCPRVQVLLRMREKAEFSEPSAEEEADLVELSETEKEARMVGQRLLDLQRRGYEVWDAEMECRRPIGWSDMVILVRAPRFKVESYAKEFARLGVPLQAKRSGFFESSEVSDLLNLLSLLDNPLQDVPVLAVLHSPLVGLTVDELAEIRLTQRKVKLWVALQAWHHQHGTRQQRKPANGMAAPANGATEVPAGPATAAKVERFLTQYARWRDLSRQATLAQRLETILAETYYLDWLATQPRGAQRQANVQQLLSVARRYDEMQSQGLYRFLQFIEAQRNATGDREPAPLETEEAVRLMSIHQSKGLEFPLVVVADLGKRFNLGQGGGRILFDERFGLCPPVRPPNLGQSYPSLPQWLATHRQRRETLGEELRILYVALTRAQDTLILAGSATKRAAENWPKKGDLIPSTQQLLRGNSYLDWLGPWLTNQAGNPQWTSLPSGAAPLWSWQIWRDADLAEEPAVVSTPPALEVTEPAPEQEEQLRQRILWQYPYAAATHEPAKTSVTALRSRAANMDADEAAPAAFTRKLASSSERRGGKLNAAAVGTAHHRFLQWADLDKIDTLAGVDAEAARLKQINALTEDELQALNREGVARFWCSEVGQRILQNRSAIKRELEFTVKITPREMNDLGLPPLAALEAEEFIVAQGTIDLAVLLPDQIWVLDFKTDLVTTAEVPARTALYGPQVNLYAFALRAIYSRPVTERWLHYLALDRTEAIDVSAPKDP